MAPDDCSGVFGSLGNEKLFYLFYLVFFKARTHVIIIIFLKEH